MARMWVVLGAAMLGLLFREEGFSWPEDGLLGAVAMWIPAALCHGHAPPPPTRRI